MKEKTLVLIKPDAMKKGIAGKIISRFEETGLKIIGVKMVWASEDLAKNHYVLDEIWAKNVFEKSKASAEKEGRKMKFKEHMEMGKAIQSQNMKFLTESPVMAIVLEGPHAIEIVRKMIGSTEPKQAAPGTIRGDFASIESYAVADANNRVARNLVHASDSVENAKREIAIWFTEKELHSGYKTLQEMI